MSVCSPKTGYVFIKKIAFESSCQDFNNVDFVQVTRWNGGGLSCLNH